MPVGFSSLYYIISIIKFTDLRSLTVPAVGGLFCFTEQILHKHVTVTMLIYY
ncbi:hypothetical protein LBKG_02112 [Lactobacillus crispatus CTV-05]|nr:hypothetical protein LBKG_02112 [Lactobacillus crispatus CTV-05]